MVSDSAVGVLILVIPLGGDSVIVLIGFARDKREEERLLYLALGASCECWLTFRGQSCQEVVKRIGFICSATTTHFATVQTKLN